MGSTTSQPLGRVIVSPTSFVVEDYAPGLTIDFRRPPAKTDLDVMREQVDLEPWAGLDLEEQLRRVDALCQQLGIGEHTSDFTDSLARFSGCTGLDERLAVTAARVAGIHADANPLVQIVAILTSCGVLSRAMHRPIRLRCHDPTRPTMLDADATHFGYILDGAALTLMTAAGLRYPLHPGSYFCVPGQAEIEGSGRAEIISSDGYRGVFSLGGPLEPWGRLQYIDGCTDTLLVPPVKLGDPCYNALFFPPQTRQTQHTHPSLRAGIVVHGKGVCKTPSGDHALYPGRIFVLPPETWHAFHTYEAPVGARSALTVIAFHPDSDVGPTDEDHPMLNRTYTHFLHRLRSAERTRS